MAHILANFNGALDFVPALLDLHEKKRPSGDLSRMDHREVVEKAAEHFL